GIGGVAAVAHEADRDAVEPRFEQSFDVAAGALFGEPGLHHRRMQLAGDDGVHADALVGILHGDDARQLDHTGFGGGVTDLRGAGPAQTGRRGDVDDGAAFLLLHHRQHVLQGQEHALEVVIDLGIPDLFAHFHRSAMGGAADIVDQHVDAAEPVETTLHHDLDRVGAGDVALLGDDLAAGGLHALDCFGNAVEIAVDGEDFRAFLGKAHGRGAAIAPARPDAAGPGDDRNLVLQASAHAAPVSRRAGAN